MNKNLKLILSLVSLACSIGSLVITIIRLKKKHKKNYINVGEEPYVV